MAGLDDGEDAAIIEQIIVTDGLMAVKDMMIKKVNAWKEHKLNIAVIGNSGSGKSTFINAIRDLTGEDEASAATGATETTKEPKSYIHPHHPNLNFWDLPGVGTTSFPRNKYLEQIDFGKYDFFLILSARRFTENDCWLADQIQRSERKFFFIRTQIDNDVNGEKQSKPKTFNETDLLQKIKSDCRKQLIDGGLHDPTVFLLSSHEKNLWDFPAAQEKIIEDFPALKKEAILLSLSCQTAKIIGQKKEMLSRRILRTAIASAIATTISNPGVAIVADRAVVMKELDFYRQQFGVDDISIELTAKSLNIDSKKIKEAFLKSAGLTTKEFLSETSSETAEKGFPIIGSLIAAGVFYGATYSFLMESLNETEANARTLAAFVQKTVKAHADA